MMVDHVLDDGRINGLVPVDEDVAESAETAETTLQLICDDATSSQQPDHIFVIGRTRIEVADQNVGSDVEDGLGADLQAAFGGPFEVFV